MPVRAILMVHPHADLYGSDRVFLASVEAMVQAGWRVVVSVPTEGRIAEPLRETGAELVLCPAPVLRRAALRPVGLIRLLSEAARSVRPALRLLRETRPDVVYVNTLAAPSWTVLARVRRHPVLVHVHEAEDGLARFMQVGLALPMLAADVVVANSEASARSLTHVLPRLASRIRLVYNGVPGPARTVDHTVLHQPVRLVVLGRLSPRKGTDTAIDAVAELRRRGRDAVLRLVGSVFAGYEWFEEQLRASVAATDLAERVGFDGFQHDVWAAYAQADVALVPSRVEPFGNAAVEAQLAGLPLVVTDTQGLPETVDNGRSATIVPVDDPAALASAIEAILDDWPTAVARAEAARALASQRFDPARYRSEIVDLVSSLVTIGRHSH